MRTSIACHLLRYHPSESLEVPGNVRLRFPRDSGLASHPFSHADKSVAMKSVLKSILLGKPRSTLKASNSNSYSNREVRSTCPSTITITITSFSRPPQPQISRSFLKESGIKTTLLIIPPSTFLIPPPALLHIFPNDRLQVVLCLLRDNLGIGDDGVFEGL
jgi:hypothetical protein